MRAFLLLSLQQVVQAGGIEDPIVFVGIVEQDSADDRGAIEDGIGAILEAIAGVISIPTYVIKSATDLAVYGVEMCFGFTYKVLNGIAGPVLEVWNEVGELVELVIKLPISVVQIGLNSFSWTLNAAGHTIWHCEHDNEGVVDIDVADGGYGVFHTWSENGTAVDYLLGTNGKIEWLPTMNHTMHCRASRPCPEGFRCLTESDKSIGYCEEIPETTTTTTTTTTTPTTTTSSAEPEPTAAEGDYGYAVTTGISVKYAILIGMLVLLCLCCTACCAAFAFAKWRSSQEQTEEVRPTMLARAAKSEHGKRGIRGKDRRRSMVTDATEFQSSVIPGTATKYASQFPSTESVKAVRTARLQRRVANFQSRKI